LRGCQAPLYTPLFNRFGKLGGIDLCHALRVHYVQILDISKLPIIDAVYLKNSRFFGVFTKIKRFFRFSQKNALKKRNKISQLKEVKRF